MSKNKYIFTVVPRLNSVELDSFYQLKTPALVNLDPVSFQVAMKIDPNLCKEDHRAVSAMMFRMRYAAAEGFYVVTTEDFELSRDELECLIQSKYEDDTLVEWLKEAKI